MGEGDGFAVGEGHRDTETDSIQRSGQDEEKGEVRGLATVCSFHAALGNVGQMCV